jgi:hypothetical protein
MHNKQKRVQLLLKVFDLIAIANTTGGFAYQLQKGDEKHEQHKIYYPLSEEYPDISWQAEYTVQDKLNLTAAECVEAACFYCVEPKKSCFINTLPNNASYRFKWGFEPIFRYVADRRAFKKELAKNLDTVCFPDRTNPNIDK